MYRILTENKNKDQILDLVSVYFEGFTVFEGIGFWKTLKEDNLTIEIETDDQNKVYEVAKLIKNNNKQEAVLVQKIYTKTNFI